MCDVLVDTRHQRVKPWQVIFVSFILSVPCTASFLLASFVESFFDLIFWTCWPHTFLRSLSKEQKMLKQHRKSFSIALTIIKIFFIFENATFSLLCYFLFENIIFDPFWVVSASILHCIPNIVYFHSFSLTSPFFYPKSYKQ